jgi:hypothetical protein
MPALRRRPFVTDGFYEITRLADPKKKSASGRRRRSAMTTEQRAHALGAAIAARALSNAAPSTADFVAIPHAERSAGLDKTPMRKAQERRGGPCEGPVTMIEARASQGR